MDINNNIVDISNISVNSNNYPYGDNLSSISYDIINEISDNNIYYETIMDSNIDYGNIPYNGTYNDISRNRYNNEDDIDGYSYDVSAQDVLNNDIIDKYFAYEYNPSLDIEIVRIRKNDLINNSNYGHIVTTSDWYTVKRYNPTNKVNTTYLMDSNEYYIRWNYNIQRYHYDKTNPINFVNAYYTKSSYNTSISKYVYFDFTQFGLKYYPNKLLDISYTTLPHYTNNEVDFYYKNLNISFPEKVRNDMIVNFFYNHNDNIRVKINIFILKPDYVREADQSINLIHQLLIITILIYHIHFMIVH